MSKYTTELRYICETLTGRKESVGLSETYTVIRDSLPHLFSFDFPIYDESHRKELEFKIVLHYYRHEIGFETVGEFKRALWSKLMNIMPYYNEMYRIDALQNSVDPLRNFDYTTTFEGSHVDTDYTSGTQNGRVDNLGTQETETDYTGTQETETDYTGTQETETDYTGTQNTDVTHTGATTNTKTFANTDTDTKNLQTTVKHSDTPQGSLTGLTNDTYLSDASITSETGTDTMGHTGTITDKLEYSDDMADTTTRTDNLNTDTTRTDNLNTDTTRTDNLNTDTTITNNLVTDSNTTYNTEGNAIGSSEHTEHTYGYRYGDNFLDVFEKMEQGIDNIDLMIINELKDLFMLLW